MSQQYRCQDESGQIIFSVCCLALAKILKNILESREKKGNWESAVKGSPVAKSPFTKP